MSAESFPAVRHCCAAPWTAEIDPMAMDQQARIIQRQGLRNSRMGDWHVGQPPDTLMKADECGTAPARDQQTHGSDDQ